MRNVRRHFRLDVVIPAVIKLADQNEVVRLVVPELASGQWQSSEINYDQQLAQFNQALLAENELAGKVIGDLVLRVNLLCEAIVLLVQGHSVYERIEFYKTRRGKTPLAMQLKPGSATADLLRSFNAKLDFYFDLCDKAINKDYADYLQALAHGEFVFDEKLTDVTEKALYGSLLAKSVLAMHDKLVRHIPLLIKFRQEVSYLVDKNAWPLCSLNLSAGGVGFISQDPYPKFARLHVDFRFPTSGKAEVFNMTGNIVNSRAVPEGHYIAVEFTNAAEAIQHKIILLLQNEELNQLILWQRARRSSVASVTSSSLAGV
jgi:hypothetical protein